MAVSFLNIVPPVLLSTTQSTVYTVGNSITTIIDKATISNTSTTVNVSVSIHLVPAGEPVSNENLIVNAKVIECGDTYLLPELVNQTLPVGTEIVTIAGTDSILSLRISGREIT